MRNRWITFCVAFVLAAAQAGFSPSDDNPRYYQELTPVKDRPEVNQQVQLARMDNGRVMYRLGFDALVGAPLAVCIDKQIEGIRRPYAPYKPLPTPDKFGYTALGLEPAGNWDDMGFFDLYINDVGLTYTAPAFRTFRQPNQLGVELIWQNSQARVTQTFLLRDGDDKLLMQLRVDPPPGQTIDRLVLRLKNVPALGNTAYGNPATRSSAIATALGEEAPAKRIDLDPARQCWVACYNQDLGASPSGLLFLPGEVEKGHLLLGKDEVHTTLFLAPKKRTFHFALWELPHQPNAPFVSFLRQRGDTLRGLLAALAGKDWTQPLPAENAPPHLTDAVYPPTPADQQRGYVASQLDPFEYADANSLPTSSLNTLSLATCPGQAEPASFLLYGLRDLGQVTLQPSDLVSATGTKIPAAQCDLRVVKVWLQRTGTWGGPSDEFVMTPELLVRNDLLPMKDIWTPKGPGTPGLITGPAITTLPRDTARQCFLTLTVPEKTTPGVYQGNITLVSAAGKGQIPITLEVLPFTLRSADDRYILGIFYRGMPFPDPKPDNPVTAEYVTPERFTRDMQTLRTLGFNTLCSIVPPGKKAPEYLDSVFPTLKRLGFRSPVIVAHWGYAYDGNFDEKTTAAHKAVIEEYLRYCKEHNYLTPTFYGIDEPTANQYNGIEVSRKRAAITRQVSVGDLHGTYTIAGDTLGELIDSVDYPIVSAYFTNRPEMKRQCEQFLANGSTPLYYWQIWGEYPKGTRLNAGYFLYASGYRGVFPYAYQHFASNPYDEYEPGIKPMLLVYPSADGPVATLESEAVRCGFTDLRYLVTLDDLLKQAVTRNPARAADLRKSLDDLLAKYGYDGSQNWGRMIYGAINWPEHQTTVPNRQFDADRRQVIRMIQECREMMVYENVR